MRRPKIVAAPEPKNVLFCSLLSSYVVRTRLTLLSQTASSRGLMLFSNTSSFAQRRAGRVLPDRAQHGCCARAYRDISTACLGIAAPLGAPEQCSNFAFKLIQKRSEEHTSELQSRGHLVCRTLIEKKKIQ